MGKRKKSISRTVILSEDIDEKIIGDIIFDIFEINYDDRDIRIEDREPINFILNSFGGSVYDGFGLIGAMEQSETPIHIFALGKVMSMALLILCFGHKRISSKFSTFMFHGMSLELGSDKIVGHKMEIKESERLQKMYNDTILTKTKIPIKLLEEAMVTKSEIYWNASQALKFGIVDKII